MINRERQARTAELRSAESPAYAAPPRSKAARGKQAQAAAAAAAACASDAASASASACASPCASNACASNGGDAGYVKPKLTTIVPWAQHRCARLRSPFGVCARELYSLHTYCSTCFYRFSLTPLLCFAR